MEENRIPKRVLCIIWKPDQEVDQEIDGKMKWGKMKNSWKSSRKKVYNREELKKHLRTARNCCVLHMPMELM
jgi:hypothetical protein